MAIQLLRGTTAQIANNSNTSLAGQPLYDIDKHILYVGDGITSINTLKGTQIGLGILIGEGVSSLQQSGLTNPLHNPRATGLGSVALGGFRGDKPNETPQLVPDDDNIVGKMTEDEYNDTTTLSAGIQSYALGGGTRAYGDWSFVMGKDSKAVQRGSVAFGGKNLAGNPEGAANAYSYAFVAGGMNEARGGYSAVFGTSNVSRGQSSFATGENNNANGFASAVFGQKNTVSVGQSFAAGYNNNVNAAQGTGFGSNNTVESDGISGFVTGSHNTVNGDSSFASGKNNTVNSNYSAAFGLGHTVNSDGALFCGKYSNGSATDSYGKLLFAIGNGNETTQSNLIEAYGGSGNGTVKVNVKPKWATEVLRVGDIWSAYDSGRATSTDAQASGTYRLLDATFNDIKGKSFTTSSGTVSNKPTKDNDVLRWQEYNLLDNKKSDKSTTLSGYGIADSYTKTEVNDKIDSEISRVIGRENELDAKIDTEIARAVSVENQLNSKIEAEINNIYVRASDKADFTTSGSTLSWTDGTMYTSAMIQGWVRCNIKYKSGDVEKQGEVTLHLNDIAVQGAYSDINSIHTITIDNIKHPIQVYKKIELTSGSLVIELSTTYARYLDKNPIDNTQSVAMSITSMISTVDAILFR